MTFRFPLKVLLPLALGVVVSLAILVFSEIGYQRLELANRQGTGALEIEAKLNDLVGLTADAETGQRGFLLTGDPSYLEPYKAAVKKLDATLADLRETIAQEGTPPQRDRMSKLSSLIGRKFNELEVTLALNEKSGREAAFQLIDTGIGKRTMDEIRTEAAAMTAELRTSIAANASRWRRDIEFARVGMAAMTAFTVLLLLVVWMLARREIARREEERRRTIEEKAHLENLVSERTGELTELLNYVQTVREEEKSHLARDIHDELGGILVGAKMDVAWAAEHLKAREPAIAAKLARALTMLDEGVEIKRRVIEELRPTLLDNLGLSAALDWQIRQTCERAGLKCALKLADVDADIPPEMTIALYRIVQEALTNIVKYAKARNVTVDMKRSPTGVSLVLADDGIGLPSGAETNRLSHGISGMRQRIRALNGDFRIRGTPRQGTTIEVHLPISPTTAPASEVQTAQAGAQRAPA
jgi:signal transduction histidine kinase